MEKVMIFELPQNPDDIKANVFHQKCPARYLLDKVSGKWSLLIIDALKDERRRNGELMRLIEGISQKMLTQTLRELEKIKVVQRYDMQTIPPHVEYELSELGQSLCQKICALDRWIEDNMLELIDH